MTRETRTAAELKDLLDEAVQTDGRRLDGAQWIRIVSAEPENNGGANWTVSHSGEAGGFSDAIDQAQAGLKVLYDLRSDN